MVLEAGRSVLSKVLISGGGRCNVMHNPEKAPGDIANVSLIVVLCICVIVIGLVCIVGLPQRQQGATGSVERQVRAAGDLRMVHESRRRAENGKGR